MRPPPITVTLLDPHPAIRKVLSARIEEAVDLDLIGSFESTRICFKGFDERLPDVVVTELVLAGAQRLGIIEQIQRRYPTVKIVIFSQYEKDIYGERAVLGGAWAYLMKTEPIDRVLEAIRRADQDEGYLSPEMSAMISNQLPENGSG